jgi:hypothetical protein
MGVWPDQNAPLVGLDSLEDDRRRFGNEGVSATRISSGTALKPN